MKTIVLAVAVPSVATVAINYLVDPYGIYRPPETGGLRSRPRIPKQERLNKSHAVLGGGARTLLLGNSRVRIGIDPRNPLLVQPAYNAGFGAGRIGEAKNILEYGLEARKPALVILGLDPMMLTQAASAQPMLAETPATNASGLKRLLARLADLEMPLFSLFALHDSVRTLLNQSPPFVRYERGYEDPGLMEPRNGTAQRLLANQRIIGNAGTDAKNMALSAVQLDALKTILRECFANRIRLVIFFHPLHAGVLDVYLDEEGALRARLEAVRQILADSPGPVELWTFMGFNEITMDPMVDAADSERPMRYYWEASHYREIVGGMMIRRMFGTEAAADAAAGFGRRVDYTDPGWTDSELRRLETERVTWKQRLQAQPRQYPILVQNPLLRPAP